MSDEGFRHAKASCTLTLAVAVSASALHLAATLDNGVGLKPQLGFNSWYHTIHARPPLLQLAACLPSRILSPQTERCPTALRVCVERHRLGRFDVFVYFVYCWVVLLCNHPRPASWPRPHSLIACRLMSCARPRESSVMSKRGVRHNVNMWSGSRAHTLAARKLAVESSRYLVRFRELLLRG